MTKYAEEVSHDAHLEFLNNIRTIKLLSIVEANVYTTTFKATKPYHFTHD